MLRLFVAQPLAAGADVRLAGDDLRHLRVLRLGPGAPLRLVGPEGIEHEAVLVDLTGRDAVARVGDAVPVRVESALDLVLAPALLKAPRMDLVVEKATELGVQRLVPVETRHAVARGAHLDRWRRIALAAARQCRRTRVPTIEPPRPLRALLEAPWPGVRVVASEHEDTTRLAALPAAAAAVIALVGPEGGFADDELVAARAHGFVPLTLGPRVLRAETAAIVVAAHCQARWGDG